MQVHDLLGITPGKKSKFVKNFLEGRDSVLGALEAYVHEVKKGIFPAKENTFSGK